MHASDEGRGGLLDNPYSYRQGNNDRVFVSWRGRQVMVLKGAKARSFLQRLSRLSEAEQQMFMAKTTGNFKRGNER